MKTVLIPMAGKGTRFVEEGYEQHKPLIKIAGKTLIEHSINSLGLVGWNYVIVAREISKDYIRQLEELLPYVDFIWIDNTTKGAAETCLAACNKIDPNSELIVTNCDQYLDWKPYSFLEKCKGADGAVLTYLSSDPKNSFCRIREKKVIDIVEKEVVSNHALVGVHWWRSAKDFFSSAKDLVKSIKPPKEAYISETYIPMLNRNSIIKAIPIEGKYWSLGTPEDLKKYIGYLNEYNLPKSNTYFIDLDGTIFKHSHSYSDLFKSPELCPGVKNALDELDSKGEKIILVSSRKESARKQTEEILNKFGIPYDQLILGITQGIRFMINDIKNKDSKPRAKSINLIVNKGFKFEDLA